MLQMNVLTMTKHLKKSCLLECKQRAAEHQVYVEQKLMHMYELPKSSQRLCSTEERLCQKVFGKT